MYRKLINTLNSLLKFEGDEDYAKPSKTAIDNARVFIGLLSRNNTPCPHDVYNCPSGEIVIEWQFPSKIIIRVFFEDNGKITEMTTYPDREAKFRYY
jgi:hypothetical protein